MLTYNQEHFIGQTIESILMQRTNFTYQLVIGEDFSTDSTLVICIKFAEQFPDKIKLLPSLGKNIGLIANYMRTIKECDGKYIAICDGDDYWIDEYKLQKQVDFLENNPDYSVVYTNYSRLFPNGSFKKAVLLSYQKETSFEELIDNNFIPSVTVIFKNLQLKESIPNWIGNHFYGDWATYLWVLKNSGKIYFMDEVTAVYRVQIGVSHLQLKENSLWLKANLKILNDIFNDNTFIEKRPIVKKTIVKRNIHLMSSYNRERQYCKGLFQLFKCMKMETDRRKVGRLFFYSIYKSCER
jgi:glycosyltransferase involved in cell wall biosynthesis